MSQLIRRFATLSLAVTFCLTTFVAVSAQPPTPPAGGGQARGGGRGPATPPLIMTSSAWAGGRPDVAVA
jgi:hypothetical protein